MWAPNMKMLAICIKMCKMITWCCEMHALGVGCWSWAAICFLSVTRCWLFCNSMLAKCCRMPMLRAGFGTTLLRALCSCMPCAMYLQALSIVFAGPLHCKRRTCALYLQALCAVLTGPVYCICEPCAVYLQARALYL